MIDWRQGNVANQIATDNSAAMTGPDPELTGNLTGKVMTADQPNITNVGTLGSLTVSGMVTLGSFTKAALPTATKAGQMIFVSDATGAHVTGSLCFSSAAGTASWIDVTTGVAVV